MASSSGLVHGDLRSHVILSPSAIVSGSSHVCEAIAIAINTAYEDHQDLPATASIQLDNASPNHSMLVFSFCAQYVLFKVFDKFRVRFDLVPRPAVTSKLADARFSMFTVVMQSVQARSAA